MLGLDGAGKTSVMHCLATGSLEQDVSPTEGISAISINKEDLQIEFLEGKLAPLNHKAGARMRENAELNRHAFFVFRMWPLW